MNAMHKTFQNIHPMFKVNLHFSALLISSLLITSCNQSKALEKEVETTTAEKEIPATKRSKKPHNYGGWYCPDNFIGFPPMDIAELNSLSVISDRLPTEEETRSGQSLMYFDALEHPFAMPLNIPLPRVARMYTEYNKLTELVIVIQAVVIDNDTIVGFRYPNGGNGSARINEVDFLNESEVADLGSKPFVYIKTELKASKQKIWKGISQTAFAKKLGKKFNNKALFESEWNDRTSTDLLYEYENVVARGVLASLWGNLYLQIDYDSSGFHYSEKILVIDNEEKNTCELFLVTGPYPQGMDKEQKRWNAWMNEVKAKVLTK